MRRIIEAVTMSDSSRSMPLINFGTEACSVDGVKVASPCVAFKNLKSSKRVDGLPNATASQVNGWSIVSRLLTPRDSVS